MLGAPGFLPGESHGQRSLVGYSSWGRKELDRTEQLNGEGNGNPLQGSRAGPRRPFAACSNLASSLLFFLMRFRQALYTKARPLSAGS